MDNSAHFGDIRRGTVVRSTPGGEELGRVGRVYADDSSGRPEWVTVRADDAERFLPLREAASVDGDLVVPYGREQVLSSPVVDGSQGHLSRTQETDLYGHYGLLDPTAVDDPGLLYDSRRPTGGPRTDVTADDASGPAGDPTERGERPGS